LKSGVTLLILVFFFGDSADSIEAGTPCEFASKAYDHICQESEENKKKFLSSK
jgi:hypothetical protein